jgi:hypothetical protein
MSLKSFAKAFFLAVCAINAAYAEKPPITDARQFLAYIDREGAEATLDKLSSQQMDRVFVEIFTGAPLWLEVAKKLAPATDASNTLGIEVALARALTHNPEGVLPLLGAPKELPIGIDRVCSLPFIESTERQNREHVRRVRAALRRVTSPALAAKKAECLKIINEAGARYVPPV